MSVRGISRSFFRRVYELSYMTIALLTVAPFRSVLDKVKIGRY